MSTDRAPQPVFGELFLSRGDDVRPAASELHFTSARQHSPEWRTPARSPPLPIGP